MRSRFLLVAVWAFVGTLFVASPAGAGGGKLISDVSLNVSHRPTFQGRVSMPSSTTCIENRTVILYAFRTSGRRYEFGRGQTNAKGKWSLRGKLDGATAFQATVKATSNQWGVRCLADSSQVKSIRP